MKRFISFLISTAIIFSCVITASAENITDRFSVADAVIVISENATDNEVYAAEKLEYYLEQILSKDVEITKDEVSGEKIIVGNTAANIDFDTDENGSYIIKSDKNKIVIAGVGSRGTLYGVYAFLEDYCGCRWYEKDIIKIPQNTDLTIPADIDVAYTPYFEYTDTDTASSRDPEFSMANGLNGNIYRTLTDEQGGTVGYIGLFCHTFSQYYCSPDKYFAEHPEYYALNGDVRTPNQLCLTNPDVFDIVYEEVIDLLEAYHDPSKSIQILSLTQHDYDTGCECENCAAIDNENGSKQGSNLAFVNAMAERVKATGKYDNVVFDTFAYGYTRKPPTKIVPRDDVIIRLCSIECCFGHPLDDPDCPENAAFMKDLADWGKICDRVYIWDYVANFFETCVIFPNFNVLQRNVQIFAENGVKGIYEEGIDYIDRCDTEFGEMRTYLLSQLMKDPYMDYYAEMNGYLEAVYGPGWENIREFIDIISEHAVTERKHLTIWQEANKTLYGMTDKEIKYCDTLWHNAIDSAETEEQKEQIVRSQLSWRYWKCANKKLEFSRLQFPYGWMTENDNLYNDLIDHDVRLFGTPTRKRDISECEMMHYWRIPIKWTTLYDEDIWFTLSPYFMEFYKFLGTIYDYFTV